jgi:hypothetical protein
MSEREWWWLLSEADFAEYQRLVTIQYRSWSWKRRLSVSEQWTLDRSGAPALDALTECKMQALKEKAFA